MKRQRAGLGNLPWPGSLHDLSLTETPDQRLQIAIVGCGYWGPNLIRNFSSCKETRVAAVCDANPKQLERALALCPVSKGYSDIGGVLGDPDVQAVVIATPPATHARLGTAALEAGKHVLIEKPLATCEREADALVRLAVSRGLVLMVDHTFIYCPAIQKIKSLIDEGQLGQIYYIDSVRINLGLFQNDVNVLWDLAPHDLSIVDYLMGRAPVSVSAFGACHASADLEDVCYLNLDYGDNLLASFHVNWLSPVKVRHLIIGGSRRSLVYNDLNPSEQIKVYDRGITVAENAEARRGVLINYRTGDVWSPHLGQEEPLQNVVRHFASCIRQGVVPLTDGRSGLRIVRILEAAQHSIKLQGQRILLDHVLHAA
jgi:predicted dehydrogenase